MLESLVVCDSEGKVLVVFFNGSTHAWLSVASLGNHVRLLTEETETEMLK